MHLCTTVILLLILPQVPLSDLLQLDILGLDLQRAFGFSNHKRPQIYTNKYLIIIVILTSSTAEIIGT